MWYLKIVTYVLNEGLTYFVSFFRNETALQIKANIVRRLISSKNWLEGTNETQKNE